MRDRPFLRRLTAVLSSALLLQLSLVASGTLCRMHGDHSMASSAMASMATPHGVQGMHAAASATQGSLDPTQPAVTDVASGTPAGPCDMSGKSCDTPWSPGGCASMGTCVTAVSAVPAAGTALSPATRDAALVVASADMPIGPVSAPELPPPRA